MVTLKGGASAFLIPAIVLSLIAAFFIARGWETPTPPVEVPTEPEPAIEVIDETPGAYKDMIRLEMPLPEAKVTSPLLITGAARGGWYSEGAFPVILTDWNGKIIAEAQARATDEWMTSEYVPFEATLNFTADTTVSNRGTLILKKDNPSGLPQNEDALEISVTFPKEVE